MWFRALLNSLTQSPRCRRERKQRARRLLLEGLEDRQLLALVPAVSYAVSDGPQAVITADFNNDGRLDLATANSGNSSVSVLLGNADGSFQSAVNSATGSGPLSIVQGDFNADGKRDLATANSSAVSILLGNGNGTFQSPTHISIGPNLTSIAVGDFNSDGKLDLGATTNDYYPGGGGCDPYGCWGWPGWYTGQLNVLLGTGGGSFASPIAASLGYGYHQSTAVGDFNSDGKLDFASTGFDFSYYTSTVDVVLGTGTGTFGSSVAYGTGSNPKSLAAGDVNGDGKLDLVTANVYGNSVSVLLGAGTGSFAGAQNFNAGSQPDSLALADFNGDAVPDLVTSSGTSGNVSVLLGVGGGTFKPPVIAVAGGTAGGIAAGNFDGSNGVDVAVTNPSADSLQVLLNNGTWPALDSPAITIADAQSVVEGNTGTVNANFTVSLSAPSNQVVSVVYSTQDSSATGGSDYQATSETLTFNPGETSKIISIPVLGDRMGESSESFLVNLSDPLNAFVADATGLGNIVDDEPLVSISGYFSDVEGNAGTKAFTFTVSLSSEYDAPVTVDYSTADLTPDEEYWYGLSATADVDYLAQSGTVTFAAHQTTSEVITVLVNGDRLGESDEVFSVNLSNPNGARLSGAQGFGTIVNDEPYVWMEYYRSQPEGNSGQSALTFTLQLSNEYDEPVTVTYETVDGSAVAGSDFVGITGGTATIAAHTTSQSFSVLINGDTLAEQDEYFSVRMTNVSGATLSGGTAYAYILDDDTPPSIYIEDSWVAEGNGGTTVMAFTIWLSQPSGEGVWVNYATANGSARTADNDYVAQSGMIYFAPGETYKTLEVVVKGDTRREKDETFYVNLSGATGGTIGDSRAVGSILNDDGGGRGNGKGNQKLSSAEAVDVAIASWLTPKGRRR